MLKHCNHCNQDLDIEQFPKKKSSKDGHASRCKKYYKERNDSNYVKNKDHIIEVQKKRKEENREHVLEIQRKSSKKYREKNLEKEKIRHYKYKKERRERDIEYRILGNLRNRLNTALKRNQKKGKTIDLLGCSIPFLRGYLEGKFTEGMSWEAYNKGLLHIDHIRPLASFDLSQESEQKLACHYTNLQPLWAVDNIRKGAKYEETP